MSESNTARTGACLCGKVRFVAPSADGKVGACHCSMCRGWGGGPWLAMGCGTDVSFDGGDNVAVFDSSPWAERGFCKLCGTHLYYRIKQSGEYILSAGLFEDENGFLFDHQVFVDERPEYYCFANQTRDMTGPEVFAMYAPPEGSAE